MGVDATHLTVGVLAAIAVGLALPLALWWTYFVDSSASEHALAAAEPGRRSQLAVTAFGVAHMPMLLGIVVSAAGIHGAIAHPGERSSWPSAIALGAGAALFLAGMAFFRRSLGIGPTSTRLLGAAAALATIPAGALGSAGLQLALLVAVLATLVASPRERHAMPDEHVVGEGAR